MSGENLNINQDVMNALISSNMNERFARIAPSYQKEYLKWIYEIKKPATRAIRIQ
jgi:uncharacterized protein YdeI (YjbR/CyaY-like superfamily)